MTCYLRVLHDLTNKNRVHLLDKVAYSVIVKKATGHTKERHRMGRTWERLEMLHNFAESLKRVNHLRDRDVYGKMFVNGI
jgi:hypothetical protein